MNKRTIKAGQFQRHYPTNGILMYRERKNLIDVPEGTLVRVDKARRQSHLCTIKCVEQEGKLVLGSGRKAIDICIAIETEFLPKLKIETPATETAVATTTKGKGKGKGKGTRKPKTVAAEAVVAGEQPAGVGPADLAGEQPAQQAEQPQAEAQPAPAEQAPEVQAEVPAAPAAEAAV